MSSEKDGEPEQEQTSDITKIHNESLSSSGGSNKTKGKLKNASNEASPAGSASSTKKMAFVHKLYAMLSDPNLSHLLWWTRDEKEGTFALNSSPEFANALTHYFKHGNVSSFVRQLHMYGFHKVSDKENSLSLNNARNKSESEGTSKKDSKSSTAENNIWEFRHASGVFRKGDEGALSTIKRRQPASSSKNSTVHHLLHHNITTELPSRSRSYQDLPINPMLQPQPTFQPYNPARHSFPMASAYYNQYHPDQISEQRLLIPTEPHPHPHSHSLPPLPYNPQEYASRAFQKQQPTGPEQPHQYLPSLPSQGTPSHQSVRQQPQRDPPHYQQDYHRQSQPYQPVPYSQHYSINNVMDMSRNLAASQQELSKTSEQLRQDVHNTSGDVLRFSDTLPHLQPLIQKIDDQNYQRINDLKNSFQNRAMHSLQQQPVVPPPLPSQHQLFPYQERQDPSTRYHFQPQFSFAMPRYDSSVASHPSNSENDVANKKSSITAVESSSDNDSSKLRAGSLVDPLARVPHNSVSSTASAFPPSHLSSQSGSLSSSTSRESSLVQSSIPKLESSPRKDFIPSSFESSALLPATLLPSNASPQLPSQSKPVVYPGSPKAQHFIDKQRQMPRAFRSEYQFRHSDTGISRGSSLPLALDSSGKKQTTYGNTNPVLSQIRKSILAIHKIDNQSNIGSSVDLMSDVPNERSLSSSISSGGSVFTPTSSISSAGSIRTSKGSVSSISHLLNNATYKPTPKSSLSNESLEPPMGPVPSTHSHLLVGEPTTLSTIGEGSPNSKQSAITAGSGIATPLLPAQNSEGFSNIGGTKKVISVSSLLDTSPEQTETQDLHEAEETISRKRVHSGSSSSVSSDDKDKSKKALSDINDEASTKTLNV